MARRDAGDAAGARKLLADGIATLQRYGANERTADALRLLEDAQAGLADDVNYARSRKSLRYSASTARRMRSCEHWVGEGGRTAARTPPEVASVVPLFIMFPMVEGSVPKPRRRLATPRAHPRRPTMQRRETTRIAVA